MIVIEEGVLLLEDQHLGFVPPRKLSNFMEIEKTMSGGGQEEANIGQWL